MNSGNSEAGPSRLPAGSSAGASHIEIPSYGPEFFEYRRSLFLAGLPLPPQPSADFPESYTVPFPFPDPCPPSSAASSSGPSIVKLEKLLREEGAEETVDAWISGLAGVHARLDGGKKLSKPLKLGLVIKVLKAGWIQDGTWPTDPRTRRAIKAPGSPILSAPRSSASGRSVSSMPPSRIPPRPPTPIPTISTPLPGDTSHTALSSSPRSPSFAQQQQQHSKRDTKDGGDRTKAGKPDMKKRKESVNGDHG